MQNAFKQGEHICAVYDSEAEQIEVAAEYLADGLWAGERAFYVVGSGAALQRFHAALRRAGVNADLEIRRRALIESTTAEAHLVEGYFDTERMLRLLNDAVESALNDGFTGLRTCGDMSWLLSRPPGSEQVIEYEALLNAFFSGVRGSGMCQYDRRRLPPNLIAGAMETHSTAVLAGRHLPNRLYRPRRRIATAGTA